MEAQPIAPAKAQSCLPLQVKASSLFHNSGNFAGAEGFEGGNIRQQKKTQTAGYRAQYALKASHAQTAPKKTGIKRSQYSAAKWKHRPLQ